MDDLCELTKEQLKRNYPKTQSEGCLVAARVAIAAHGPMPEHLIRSAARGLARGLFGPAYSAAHPRQRRKWIDLAEREYRRALGDEKEKT